MQKAVFILTAIFVFSGCSDSSVVSDFGGMSSSESNAPPIPSKSKSSKGWKDWNEWRWEQPTWQELIEKMPEFSVFDFKLEFFSTWDERFSTYSTGADGFVVVHIFSRRDTEDLVLEINSEDIDILGDCQLAIDLIEKMFPSPKFMTVNG